MLVWMLHPSNARITGIEEGLDLHKNRCPWILNIFYITFIVFHAFALMWRVVPPNIWAAFVVFGWGIAATLKSAKGSRAIEMVCRFVLDTIHESEQTVVLGLLMLMIYRTIRGWLWARRPSFAVPLLCSP